MKKHPYKPANKRGFINRIHTTPDSVDLPRRDRGPCIVPGCGRGERQMIHQAPFDHKYTVKEVEQPERKGVGKDAPVY